MTTKNAGIVYGAATVSRILGVPCECNDPVPEAVDGAIIIYHGGWDLFTVSSSNKDVRFFFNSDVLVEPCMIKGFVESRAEPGYYRLIFLPAFCEECEDEDENENGLIIPDAQFAVRLAMRQMIEKDKGSRYVERRFSEE